MATERSADELEILEGDGDEPEVGRHRDVGHEMREAPIADVRRRAAVTVPPDSPVEKALALMREKEASAVLVVERRTRKLLGIFTERDVVTRALPSRGWAKAPVRKFMTPSPESLQAKDPVAYALNKMSVGRFRHVPLVDEAGRPTGVLSASDLMEYLVELCPEEILNLPPEPDLALHRKPEGE